MTGPEHYREAEDCIALANQITAQGGDFGSLLIAAQLHAMLALVAATALPNGGPGSATHGAWVMAVAGQ